MASSALAWHHHRVEGFVLDSGERLPELVTAYATRGQLNAARDNAVLVLHGYTTGPGMLQAASNAAEGSWSDLIGPGLAVDTERWFVICPNALGSSYGSTGPGSIDPRCGKPYGSSFPRITMGDIVRAQVALVDTLGIAQLAAVIGPSMGAFQAFEWAAHHPVRVRRVVAAVGTPYDPFGPSHAEGVLARLASDPGWNEGRYAETPGSMTPCLTQMRMETLVRYGIDADLASRFPDAGERQRQVRHLAESWAREFDAGSLMTLALAIEGFDVRPQLSLLRAPLLFVISRSDALFSPALARDLAPLFDAAGVAWSYVELDSDKGHLASGADAALWADTLRTFLQTEPGDWRSWGLQTPTPRTGAP